MFGQNVNQDAEGQREDPGQQGRLPQVRQQLWSSGGFHAWSFSHTAIEAEGLAASDAGGLGCLGQVATVTGVWFAPSEIPGAHTPFALDVDDAPFLEHEV